MVLWFRLNFENVSQKGNFDNLVERWIFSTIKSPELNDIHNAAEAIPVPIYYPIIHQIGTVYLN